MGFQLRTSLEVDEEFVGKIKLISLFEEVNNSTFRSCKSEVEDGEWREEKFEPTAFKCILSLKRKE